MTTGALIFAHNNGHTDYEAMARWSARNIQRHLGIPVHIVTEKDNCDENARWFDDYQQNVVWHNQSRVTAWDVSPWDRTLLLDADYVIASDQLRTIIDSTKEFLCFKNCYDATGIDNFESLETFGDVRMPMWWATVICFDKTPATKLIFDTMSMIKNNWQHYRRIYKINQPTYRNDHALSIALCLVNGHVTNIDSMPWNMTALTPKHKLIMTGTDSYRVDFVTADAKPKWISLDRQDFHAMGKQQLGEIVAGNS
jgi:hypothetical protein